MFRSLLNLLQKSSAPQSKSSRSRKHRGHRPRTLRLESLEGREMFSTTQATTTTSTPADGKPIEGIVWSTPISFHAHYTNTKPKLSDFKVEVQWGDKGTERETINTIAVNPNDKSVNPTEYVGTITHTYFNDGAQKDKFRVIVTNVSDKVTWDATAYNMVVSDAPLTGKAVTMQASTDKPFNNVVARFTDANPNASITEYQTKYGGATIVWKDGSNQTSKGTIQKVGNEFVVYGTHQFTRNGIFEIQVNISDDNGSKTTVYSTANVSAHFTSVKPTVTDTPTSGTLPLKTAVWGGLIVMGSQADIDTFAEMLDAAASRSPSFRALMGRIVSDTAHPVRVVAEKNSIQTFGDSFKTKVVDLADLQKFPVTVPRGSHDVTQGELVVHFMAERYAAATMGLPNATEVEDRFHLEGLAEQSKFRQEAFGQVGVTKQGITGAQNNVGRFTFFFSDQWYQDVFINPNLDILAINAPKF